MERGRCDTRIHIYTTRRQVMIHIDETTMLSTWYLCRLSPYRHYTKTIERARAFLLPRGRRTQRKNTLSLIFIPGLRHTAED